MAFEEKGWRGATFEHVAERAAVTRGALHHHFGSKATLLAEALEWGWGEYESRLFDGARPPAPPVAWLAGLLCDFVRLLRDDARFRALASATVLVAPQACGDTARRHDALEAWRLRIVDALAGSDTRIASATVAGLVLVLLQGFTVTAVTRPDDLPQPRELDAAIGATVRGLLS